MRKPLFLFGLLISISIYGNSQSTKLSDWTKLCSANNCEAAKKLCTPFADSAIVAQQAEAQKCLANVALCGHDIIQLQGDDAGGGTMAGGFTPEAVDEALVHLNLGIKLAPQDLSIHMGRLHILEVSVRYSDMVKALDESCMIYKGSNVPDAWLAYSAEFMDLRQYEVGLDFMKILDKHYPNNPDIYGNIGAFLSMLKRDSEAIPYLQKAAELAPSDPINAWDLARTYDYAGQIELADTWYKKGLSLDSDANRRKQNSCLYAIFVETKLHDRARACPMEKKDCEADQQMACAAPPANTSK
ncbi:MAG: tetratricopeptide repeat protein [Terracidiphilus sp.]|jgi:tetratricopeptide (TPR) repeat protein